MDEWRGEQLRHDSQPVPSCLSRRSSASSTGPPEDHRGRARGSVRAPLRPPTATSSTRPPRSRPNSPVTVCHGVSAEGARSPAYPTRQPRHDVDLPPGHRPQEDHHRRPQTPRTDDVGQRQAATLTDDMQRERRRRSRFALRNQDRHRAPRDRRRSSPAAVVIQTTDTRALVRESGSGPRLLGSSSSKTEQARSTLDRDCCSRSPSISVGSVVRVDLLVDAPEVISLAGVPWLCSGASSSLASAPAPARTSSTRSNSGRGSARGARQLVRAPGQLGLRCAFAGERSKPTSRSTAGPPSQPDLALRDRA